jgi:hypothetical protein
LGCSAFARRYLRNRIRFLFLRLLRCFTSAGVALPGLFNSSRSHWVHQWGFPIRRSSGQRLLPSHRGLSQVTASFIASQHQGIHLVPLVAYLNVSTYHSNIYYWRRTKLHGIYSMQGCQRTTAPSSRKRQNSCFVLGGWWARLDSNQRPRAYQARALTN